MDIAHVGVRTLPFTKALDGILITLLVYIEQDKVTLVLGLWRVFFWKIISCCSKHNFWYQIWCWRICDWVWQSRLGSHSFSCYINCSSYNGFIESRCNMCWQDCAGRNGIRVRIASPHIIYNLYDLHRIYYLHNLVSSRALCPLKSIVLV